MSPKAEDPIMVSNEDAPQSTASEIAAAPSKDASVASFPNDSSDAPAYEEQAAPEDETQGLSGEKSFEQTEAVVEEKVETEGYQNLCAKIELPTLPKLGCFDLSTIACCGLGSLYNDEAQAAKDEKAELEKKEQLENEKATQIQKVARGNLARKTAQSLKAEKEAAAAAAAAAEAAAKEAALAAAASEAAPEQAPSKVEKSAQKKSFLQKLAGLFSGCKKADSHVVSH